MDESTIRALVVGGALGVIGGGALFIRRLAKSKTPLASRLKLVLGGAVALYVAAFIVEAAGVMGLALTLGAIGVITWIIRSPKE